MDPKELWEVILEVVAPHRTKLTRNSVDGIHLASLKVDIAAGKLEKTLLARVAKIKKARKNLLSK